jgi:hypothetical protein
MMTVRTIRLPLFVCCIAAVAATAARAQTALSFHGVGWVQYGRVEKSTDTLANDYNGNPVQNSGAQITVNAAINDHFGGEVGMGVYEGHALAGQLASGGRVTVAASPYIAAANFTYRLGEAERPLLEATGGLFHYHYDDNVKDLGAYLLRGGVYPGYLFSGFETADVVPLANVLGLWLRNRSGILTSDLVVNTETQLKPTYDLSLAYIGRVRLSEAFTAGFGVNLVRLIPINAQVTRHPFDPVTETQEAQHPNKWQRVAIYVDSSGGKADTTELLFNGTKLMADFEFDPKPLFGSPESLGPEDFKLYGELAVMGLDYGKAYKAVYGGLAERMPLMIGFNLPAFKLLDHASLEVEWYGAKFRDDTWRQQPDLDRIDRPLSPIPNDISAPGEPPKTYSRDNLKWAFHVARTIEGHFKVSGQVANDHFRPLGIAARTAPTYEVATSTPKDWYWMAKIAYFF